MITLSNGHSFEYATASGALAFDGRGWFWEKPLVWLGSIQPELFTVITKTTTFQPRKGNLRLWCPWRCIRPIPGGTVNAVGLTNMGFESWLKNIGLKIRRQEQAIIASVNQEDNLGCMTHMARSLNRCELVGVELNISCPNNQYGENLAKFEYDAVRACETLKRECDHPLLVKLSIVHSMGFAKRLAKFAEAFDINSVSWKTVFPNIPSPLAKLGGGGVSGKAAQPHAWPYLSELKSNTPVPVIGCSVWEYGDIAKLRKLGADAISFGAIHIPHPTWPTKFVRRDMAEHH